MGIQYGRKAESLGRLHPRQSVSGREIAQSVARLGQRIHDRQNRHGAGVLFERGKQAFYDRGGKEGTSRVMDENRLHSALGRKGFQAAFH
jgi:hypothetical protein